jgi:hypothetical protein
MNWLTVLPGWAIHRGSIASRAFVFSGPSAYLLAIRTKLGRGARVIAASAVVLTHVSRDGATARVVKRTSGHGLADESDSGSSKPKSEIHWPGLNSSN